MAANARTEQERLAERVAALEAAIAEKAKAKRSSRARNEGAGEA